MKIKDGIIKEIHYLLHLCGVDVIRYHKPLTSEEKELCLHRIMDENGVEILDKMQTAAMSQGKALWLEMGTLLGAYRENDFIQNDYDIDVGMNAEDYDLEFENQLIQAGFKKKHFFYQYRGGKPVLTETSWSYNGMGIDIFLSFSDVGRRYVYIYGKKDDITFSKNMWEVREYCQPLAYPYESVQVREKDFVAPANIEQCLKNCYGESFMIPDPQYSAADRNHLMKIWDIDKAYAKITIV